MSLDLKSNASICSLGFFETLNFIVRTRPLACFSHPEMSVLLKIGCFSCEIGVFAKIVIKMKIRNCTSFTTTLLAYIHALCFSGICLLQALYCVSLHTNEQQEIGWELTGVMTNIIFNKRVLLSINSFLGLVLGSFSFREFVKSILKPSLFKEQTSFLSFLFHSIIYIRNIVCNIGLFPKVSSVCIRHALILWHELILIISYYVVGLNMPNISQIIFSSLFVQMFVHFWAIE